MEGLLRYVVCGCLLAAGSALDSLTYTIQEESSPGTFVGNVKTDARLTEQFSSFDYSRLTFNILAPVDDDVMTGNYFTINNASGVISSARPVDRDVDGVCASSQQCYLSFDVAVGPNDLFRVIPVHVQIDDINDNAPQFTTNEVYLNISEVAPAGSSFLLPAVSDRDGTDNGVETMSLSPVTDQFMIRWTRSVTGQVAPRLELLSPLDRELMSTFDLTVEASDGGLPPLTALLLVHVDVTDANDNTPAFDQTSYEVRVAEDKRPGSPLLAVSASDPDADDNGRVRYTLAESTAEQYGDLFRIGADSGTITLQGALDRETQDSYFLGVVATDQGKDGRAASATVTVHVDDVNDNTPAVRVTALTASDLPEIAESSDIGTFVALLSVTDLDWGRNADVSCTLSTTDFHLVPLQANKYKVVTSVIMDRETLDIYHIDIYCHDNGVPQRHSSESLTVHVVDANDNSPVFSHGDVTVHVQENTDPGTLLGQVHALDQDLGENGRISYRTPETFQRYVHVDDVTGAITTISKLDREVTGEFNVHVIAHDHGDPEKSAMVTVTVVVDDVNDNAPRFAQSDYTFVVTENDYETRELGTVLAKDADGFPYNTIQYSLVGPNSYFFSIDPANGTVFAIRPLDREDKPVLVVQCVATDVDKPALRSTTEISVYVADTNDNAPRIVSNNSVVVASSLPTGHVVTQVEAEDADAGQNAAVEFYLRVRDPSDADLLAIDRFTGVVTSQSDLTDHEQRVVHYVVTVKDLGIPSLGSERNFTISINETAAAETSPLEGAENSVSMTIIIIVVATTLVVVVVLVVAIILVLRKTRRNKRRPKVLIEKVDLAFDLEKSAGCDCEDMRPVTKIYDPKGYKSGPSGDRDSCGSAEGSTTDSGRGASEEGEQGDHGVRHNDSLDTKPVASIFPGADDSVISNTSYDFNTSYDHVRRAPKTNKNVTFEDDVTIAEIVPDQYGNLYTSCPSISGTGPWPLPEDTSTPSSAHVTVPRRTVRNVKAKDRNKKLEGSPGILTNSTPAVVQHSPSCPEHRAPQQYTTFSDSNSLLRYKLHGGDDSTGNASEITDATSTTSGSYVIDADDVACD